MKVLVFGDSCQDVHVYGKSERLCPDAPVPVLVSIEKQSADGMAGNVVKNLESLGCECTFISQEETIIKTRYVDKGTNHMFVRVDNEPKVTRIQDIKKYQEEANISDAIIISDYNKGFLTEKDIVDITCLNKSIPTFLDTKKPLGVWAQYVDFIKINQFEYEASRLFLEKHHDVFEEKLIITKDNKGADYMGQNFPVIDVPIKDKSGAGDTFLAGFVFFFVKT